MRILMSGTGSAAGSRCRGCSCQRVHEFEPICKPQFWFVLVSNPKPFAIPNRPRLMPPEPTAGKKCDGGSTWKSKMKAERATER